MIVNRRRIYIIPTRFGIALALLLAAMLIAGLNYNSNLGLAFGFLMVSLALVAMHHCHRNLLGLSVDAIVEADAFAGDYASFEFCCATRPASTGATSRSAGRGGRPRPAAYPPHS